MRRQKEKALANGPAFHGDFAVQKCWLIDPTPCENFSTQCAYTDRHPSTSARDATPMKYSNPPIVEAICDFGLADRGKWNSTVPGKFHDRVKDFYNGSVEEQHQLQAQVKVSPAGELQIGSPPSGTRTLMYRADRSMLAAVRPNGFGVHCLRPYCGWDKFRTRIDSDSEMYFDIIGSPALERIGLRYINSIILPKLPDLTDYFTIAPQRSSLQNQPVHQFLFRTTSRVDIEDKRTCLVNTTLGDPLSYGTNFGGPAVVLDIDIVLNAGTQPIPPAQRMTIVDAMKTLQRNAFEGAIKQPCRELFQ